MSELVTSPTQMFDVFRPNTMLGRYELVATIGEGGMARVILARQRGPGGFEKVVVIKVIHPQMAGDREAVGMLLDEARVAAQISHPHVVQTFELGETNGTYFIAMEYLAGESLQRVLKTATMTGSLDPRMAARIVADAADGLHAAHELGDVHGRNLGLVHRDVSLGNIVVLYNGCVKVVDFGIAKTQDRVATDTQQGQLKGKYSYMSPEQIHGETLDRRSDVFSLGVVLWECLTLRRLFHAPNVPATLMQILSRERIAPSQIRPEVPPALDAIALRALALDKRDRFQTAEEMKRALDDAIWESRCSASDIQHYMTAVFGDRMRRRQSLLASCSSSDALEINALELDAEFDETSGIRPTSAREIPVAPELREPPSHPAQGQPMVRPSAPANWLPPAAANVWLPPPTPPGLQLPPPRNSRDLSAERRRPIRWFRVAIALGVLLGGAGLLIGQLYQRNAESAESAEVATTTPPTPTTPAPTPPPPAPAPPPNPTPTSPNNDQTVTPQIEAKPVVVDEVAVARSRLRPEHLEPVRYDPQLDKPAQTAEAKDRDTGPSAKELFDRGAALFAAGKLVEAEAVFKEVLERNPRYAQAHRNLGIIYQAMGIDVKAIAALRRYLALAPKAADAAAIEARIEKLGGS